MTEKWSISCLTSILKYIQHWFRMILSYYLIYHASKLTLRLNIWFSICQRFNTQANDPKIKAIIATCACMVYLEGKMKLSFNLITQNWPRNCLSMLFSLPWLDSKISKTISGSGTLSQDNSQETYPLCQIHAGLQLKHILVDFRYIL